MTAPQLPSPRTLILLCTYNERLTLPTLLEKLSSIAPSTDLLVVDDGSPDGTGTWMAEQSHLHPHYHLLQRHGKLGLGSAILAGLRYAIDHGYTHLLNLDADLSHDPHQIPQFLQAALAHPDVALWIGSRYVPGGRMLHCGWKRHLVSRAANAYARLFLYLPARDCSSAYRLYRLSALALLPLDQLHCHGYGFLEEILWWIVQQGLPVRELPITYTEREHGTSKISIHEALGTMKVIHRLAYRRWTMMM